MKRLSFLILIVIFITSCSSMPGMPGYISESTSKFDGSKQISMEPAWLKGSLIKLSLFKNSRIKDGEVILTAIVKGAYIFSDGESLYFNVDGNVVGFKSIEKSTEINTSSGYAGSGVYIPPSNWSAKSYLVTTDFIKQIVNSENVIVKVNLRRSFAEGEFATDAPTTARPAFKKFLKKIEVF